MNDEEVEHIATTMFGCPETEKRECGDCRLCCEFSYIAGTKTKKDGTPFPEKKIYETCQYCVPGNKPCSIYENRPSFCESFKCGWLADKNIPDSLSPHNTGMVFVLNQRIERNEDGVVVDLGEIISLYEGRPNSWVEHGTKFQNVLVGLMVFGYQIVVVQYGDGEILCSFGIHDDL